MSVTLSNSAVARRVGAVSEELAELVESLDVDDPGEVHHLVAGARRLLDEASTRLAASLEQLDQL